MRLRCFGEKIKNAEGKISAGSVDSFGYLTKTDYKRTSHKPRMLKNEQGEIIAIAFVFSKENSEQ